MTTFSLRQRSWTFLAINLAALTLTTSAHSADEAAEWGLGALAVTQRKAYTGVDNDNLLLPFGTYENDWINVVGAGVEFKLARSDAFALTLLAQYSQDGYEAKDSRYLTGMKDRKGSFWLGPKVAWNSGPTTVSAELTSDVSGHSKGRQAKLEFEHGWRFGNTAFSPRIAAVWTDKKYVDYYYGVSAAEYIGKAGTHLTAGLRMLHTLAPRHTLVVDASVTALGSAAKDSPLVERSNERTLAVGYLYSF